MRASEQERERLEAGLLRLQIVAPLVVDGVDLFGLDEGGEFNRVLAGEGEVGEVLVCQDNVLLLGVLVAFL